MRDLFLTPYQGELVYSALARRQTLLGISSRRTMRDAFGTTRFMHVLFPSRLGILASRLPEGSGLALPRLLQAGTAFPYLGPFMRSEFHAATLDVLATGQCCGRACRVSEFRGGVMRAARRNLAYCPDCSREDLERRGLPAWRTVHQLPGVYVCPWHNGPLRRTEHPIASTRAFFMCPDGDDAGEPVPCPLPARLARAVARDSDALLRGIETPVGVQNLKSAVRDAMAEAGWLRPSGRAKRGLRQAFTTFHGPAVLREIGCAPAAQTICADWFYRMYEPSHYQALAPLRCTVFSDFLGISICGLLDRARSLGDEVCRAGASPRLPCVKPEPGGSPASVSPASTQLHRSDIARVMSENPGASRAALRESLAPEAYRYLRRHDREWFDSAMPKPRRHGPAVDWAARDRALARSVVWAADRLKARAGRPARITCEALLRELGLSRSAVLVPNRMPDTARQIDFLAEDTRVISARRIDWAVAVFMSAGRALGRRAIRDAAGVPWRHMPDAAGWEEFIHRAARGESARRAPAVSDLAFRPGRDALAW